MLVVFDHEKKRVRLRLRGTEMMGVLQEEEMHNSV